MLDARHPPPLLQYSIIPGFSIIEIPKQELRVSGIFWHPEGNRRGAKPHIHIRLIGDYNNLTEYGAQVKLTAVYYSLTYININIYNSDLIMIKRLNSFT